MYFEHKQVKVNVYQEMIKHNDLFGKFIHERVFRPS